MSNTLSAREFLEYHNGIFKDDLSGDEYANYVSPDLLVEFARLKAAEGMELMAKVASPFGSQGLSKHEQKVLNDFIAKIK